MRALAVGAAALAMSGCAHFTVWAGAHAQELAAVGLVAGAASQVGSLINQADEAVERARRHLEEEKPGGDR